MIADRKERQNISMFAALIATPAVGAITFPANGRIYLRSVAGCIAGTDAATITGPTARTIETPLLAAGESMNGIYVERGRVVTPATGFEVLLDTGMGRRQKIGEGA